MWENGTICANRQKKLNPKKTNKQKTLQKSHKGPFLSSENLLKYSCVAKHAQQFKNGVAALSQGWWWETCVTHRVTLELDQLHLKVYRCLWAPAAVDYWRGQNYISALRELNMLSFFIRKWAAGAESVKCIFMFHRNANINTTNMAPQVHL